MSIGNGLFGPRGGRGGTKEGRFGECCEGIGGMGISTLGEGDGKVKSMGGMGGGSFAIRSIVANKGREGEGLVVDGGSSPRMSRRVGEDGGVENKSLRGSRLIATGEVILGF